jgi:Divergent InlB B-repeat domain/PKD domain
MARLIRSRWWRPVTAGAGAIALAAGTAWAATIGGYPADRPNLLSGAAWLASAQVGQVSLLDGSTAEVAAQVNVAQPGDRIDVVQQGSTAYVVNRTAGSLRRVDGANFTVGAAARPIPDAADGLIAFAGPRGLYALDAKRGLLAAADPQSLAAAGGTVTLATRFDAGAAVVDGRGRLWVLDSATGDLIWLDGGKRGVRRGAVTAGGGLLVLADDAPVLVDTVARRAEVLDPASAKVRASMTLDLRPGEPVAVSGSPHADRLYLANARGVLTVCELTSADCSTAIPLGPDTSDLGAPVETGGRVFVPDYTTGEVWIVDLQQHRVVARPQVLLPRTKFQLLTRDGVVFFNDPDSEKAGVIQLDGTFTKARKYDPGNPDSGTSNGIGNGQQQPPANQPAPNQPPPDQPKEPQPAPAPAPPPPPTGPNIQLTVSNSNPFVGDPVTLLATGEPGRPQPVALHWDFGDGRAGDGARVTHQWSAARSYLVSVRATFPYNVGSTAATTIVVATRPVTRPVLTVTPPNGGTITGPAGIACPGNCSATFDPGQPVQLTARPGTGNVQLGWGDACTGTKAGTTCTVTMAGDRTVSATFGPPPPVRLTVTRPTGGTVTGPNGISCPNACTATFNSGQPVALTATANAGFAFAGWGGACRGTATTCNLTLTANQTVSARFTQIKRTLSITSRQFEPNGGAGVQGPPGLCQDRCTWTFNDGQVVTLTAVDQGLQFLGWGGDCASRGTNPTCTLTMDRNHSITAAFDNTGNAPTAGPAAIAGTTRYALSPRRRTRVRRPRTRAVRRTARPAG